MYVSSLLIVLQNDFCELIVWLLYSKIFLVNVKGRDVCEQVGFSSWLHYAVECLFQVKSKVGRALEELGKKDPRYDSVNWDDAQKILQFCLMPYGVSRDAGHKAIHLYLLVKTLPLNRFISLFIRLFFRGIYNFEDVFSPQCQLRRPTVQMCIKFCEFGKLSLR